LVDNNGSSCIRRGTWYGPSIGKGCLEEWDENKVAFKTPMSILGTQPT